MFRNGLKVDGKLILQDCGICFLKIFVITFFITIILFLLLGCKSSTKNTVTPIAPITKKEAAEASKEMKCKTIAFFCDKTKDMLGEMTVEQFTALVTNADVFLRELDAEKNNRVIVVLKDDPWILIQKKQYTTSAIISWLDENQKPIKKMTIQINLKQGEENKTTLMDTIISIYVDKIAPTGCIIFGAGFITVLLILIF